MPTLNEIKRYASAEIRDLLPLDEDTIGQMVEYAVVSLQTRDAVQQHFINLLGESPKALAFITKFSKMLLGDPAASQKVEKHTKAIEEPATAKLTGTWNDRSAGQQQPKSKGQQRLSHAGKGGTSTSELLGKTPKHDERQKSRAQKKLNSLKDLDSALSQLEVSDPTVQENEVVRVCNCNATRHPLFEMFPNCLNCGKIICSKEGFQPCSSCGKPLLSNEERLEIKQILQKEKDELTGRSGSSSSGSTTSQHNKKKKKKNVVKITVNGTAGQNGFRVQEKAFARIEKKRELQKKKEELKEQERAEVEEVEKELEYYKGLAGKDDELIKAQKRLDTLMSFQDHGAERTKIIDQASDYELPDAARNLWASPLERALQLKRQQKQFRKQKEQQDNRTGRGRKVLDMTIRDGKVIMHEVEAPSEIPEDLSDDEEVQHLKDEVNKEKSEHLEEASKNVWNYKADASQWAKPVYLGEGEETKTEGPEEPEEPDEPEGTVPTSSKIVQLGTSDEQEDAIFSMTGM